MNVKLSLHFIRCFSLIILTLFDWDLLMLLVCPLPVIDIGC